jgi:MoCo/4Fe-4S cofactor protein with predicted Tat translocation signal
MSKRILQHPEVPAGETTVSWRTVGQLEDTPSFRAWLTREFPRGAAEMSGEADMETSRRSFLKLMGASTALAGFGMAACRRPETYIVPYAQAPEWIIPGKALYYATAMPRAGGATPLVVTTFEGRPTKLAPNTLHADGTGTDAFAQASILDLYSPSRSRTILNNGQKASRADLNAVIAGIAKDTTAKIGFVFGADDSPTRNRLAKELAAKFSAAKFYQYEALSGESSAAIGEGISIVPDFEKADLVVSLDCDFIGVDASFPIAGFSQRRKPEGNDYKGQPDKKRMNRLYTVEGTYSLTGGMSDHRLRVAPSQVAAVASQLASAVSGSGSAVGIFPKGQMEWILSLAVDLNKYAGRSAVLAGPRQPAAVHQLALAMNVALGNVGQSVRVFQTENTGRGTLASLKKDLDDGSLDAVVFLTPSNPVFDAPSDFSFAASLAKAKTSIHLGPRPDATGQASTWHVPGAHYLEQWSDTRSSTGVYTVVQPMILPLYPDCVSELELLLALLSEDGKLLSGEGEKGAASPAYAAVRKSFEGLADATDVSWKTLLREGFLAGSSYPAATPKATVVAMTALAAPTAQSLEIVFATDASVFDGRWIDNGWLQEVPDPVTKLAWDNAALISPKTAKELGLYDEIIELEPVNQTLSKIVGSEVKNAPVHPDGESGNRRAPLIKVTVNGKTAELPVLVAFGQAENTIVLPVGYGQGYDADDELKRDTATASHVGRVGVNTGVNVYPLRTSATPYFATGAKIEKTDRRYSLAVGQEHSAMYGRAIAREISTQDDEEKGSFEAQLANVKKQGNDAHAPENISLYKQEGKPGEPLLSDLLHQWGMTIDLSSCSGCNACVIACQAENNIPIVGKEQLAKGREMHWIRMDRYFAIDKSNTFDPDSPELVPQPVACVQCESAPCETVCPVNATVHTEDGLNAMAYNRCIGTRYCANNCPYKARRFNYFDYNKRNPLIAHNLYKGPFGEKTVGEAPHLQRNPNVTVRMRGVMEKCTYCVQRLKDAKIRQKRGQKQEALVAGKPSAEMVVSNETLRVPVDSVKVACQEACPASAISFGNRLDGDHSKMFRAMNMERNYGLLQYIGTRPRTSYLARVKNPNPEMPDAPFVGKATIHMA